MKYKHLAEKFKLYGNAYHKNRGTKEGDAYLTARIQAEKLGVNLLVKTPIKVDIAKYTASPKGKVYPAYMSSPEGQRIQQLKLEIESSINSLTDAGTKLDTEAAKKVIEDICYRDEREEQQAREKKEKERIAQENKMTLSKYIKLYIEQIKSGARQTEQGRNYAPSTIQAIVTAMNQWDAFQKKVRRIYDFDVSLRNGHLRHNENHRPHFTGCAPQVHQG